MHAIMQMREVSHIFVMITLVRIPGSENGTENFRAAAAIFALKIYFPRKSRE
jgi:hypothetical protein